MTQIPAGSVPTRRYSGTYSGVEALLAEVNALSIRLNQVGRAPGSPAGLAAAAYALLQLLERQGAQTVPQIARRRATSRQNIQILINRLAGQGSVELTGNPAHRRSPLVSLTHRGRALLVQGAEAHNRLLETLASDIDEPELTGATRLLSGIRRLLTAEKTSAAAVHGPRKTPQRRRKRVLAHRVQKEDSAVAQPAAAKPPGEKVPSNEEEFPISLL